ncbi:MAG TPA: protein kinase [Burkholderiales bacterium]|nr:protein kinase [Burkholderiales bacterium]
MSAPSVYRNALPAHTVLHEYRIEQVLGAGGFGITYRARDTNLDKDVAIKEYLPGELAMRAPDGNVVAQATGHEAGYKWGLERFLQEARTLAKFSHPHIVRVLRYFEANATAYMVMDYEKGDPLKVVLQHDPQPPEAKLKALVAPLLDGLAAVHATGFLHRDIKPDNIFVRADGRPVLIDFGAARQALGGETRSLTSILTPGYAPLEQYSGEGKQGPWTDLYAMGGVLYRAVADKNPPDAVTRIRGDTLGAALAAARGKYSESFLHAIEWALTLDEKKRPQNVAQWKAVLLSEKTAAAPEEEIAKTVKLASPPGTPPRRRRWPYIVAVLLAAMLAAILWHKHRTTRDEPEQQKSQIQRETHSSALTAEQEQRLERETAAEFKSADVNRDGFLSPEEVRGRFPVVAREFSRIDTDGDGKISMQEFKRLRTAQLEKRLQKRE